MSFDTLLVFAVLLLLVAAASLGTYSYFRSPKPYLMVLRTALVLLRTLWPAFRFAILKIGKPYDPDVQKRYDAVRRRGGEWDHIRKRERL